MKKYIILPVTLLLALTACNNDEYAPDGSDGNAPVSFTASIAGQQVSRAIDNTWENGDQIGISGTSGTVAYNNVAYQTTVGDGIFTVTTPNTDIYYQTTDDVHFTAYYPWNNLATGATTISADTWGQADQKTFDFLWAQGTGNKAAKNVAFNFNHKMAKLALTVKAGTGVNFDEVKAAGLMLSEYLYKGSFDITTGVATADAASPAAFWTFANNPAENKAYDAPYSIDNDKQTITYSLILFPQSFDEGFKMEFSADLVQLLSTDLDFTTANADAGDTSAKNELVAGRQYNLSIVLNKTGLTVTGCTISNWVNVNGGEFSAN